MGQRLRITFARGGRASYLSHLELMRMWERAFRRAGWRLQYSQGFSPHPRLSFAAPLPVGVAGEAELLEVYLEEPQPLDRAQQRLAQRMPPEIEVREVEEVPAEEPAIQRRMVAAEYLVVVPEGASPDALRTEVGRVQAASSLPRERIREGATRSYDLRPMIHSVGVERCIDGRPLVRMTLRTDARGAGRPDEVLRELGLDPAECRITRLRLLFE